MITYDTYDTYIIWLLRCKKYMAFDFLMLQCSKDCHDIDDASFHQTYWAVFRIKSAGDSSSCEFE